MNVNESILKATEIIACTTIANVIVATIIGVIALISLLQTIKHFKAKNRPYIGAKFRDIDVDCHDEVSVLTHIVNFGSLPATNIKFIWSLIVDNKKVSSETWDHVNTVIPPLELYSFSEAMFKNLNESNILSPNKEIILINKITYQSVNKIKYSTTEKYKYDSHSKKFIRYCDVWKFPKG